jgi:Protein of unknown function (DUF2384)
MPTPHDPLSAKLVAAALEFHRLKLWTELERDTTFLIRLPDQPHPIVAAVIGQDGEEFGLSLFCGSRAIDAQRLWMLSDGGAPISIDDGSVLLSLTFAPLGNIPMERRKILIDAAFAARREALAPCFFTLPPNNRVRLPNRTEMRVLLSALKAISAARAEGPLESGRIERVEELFQVSVVDEGGKHPRVVRERAKLPPISAECIVGRKVCDDARSTPQSTHRWVAAIVEASQVPEVSMEEDERALVVVDEETGSIVCATLILPKDFRSIVMELFLKFIDEERGHAPTRPAEIVLLDADLAHRLEEVLADVGIRVSHAESSPLFDEILRTKADELVHELHASDMDAPPAPEHEPTTVAEWKALDAELFECIEDHVLDRDEEIESSIEEFFGDVESGWQEIDSAPEAMLAFAEWFASHELDDEDRTLLERWIECTRSPAVKTLLEARQRATVSFYRITELDADAGAVQVVDVFSGASRSIVDGAMSRSAPIGAIVALRLYETPVGLFAVPASRPFSTTEFDAVLAFLEDGPFEACEEPITADVLTEAPELLGLLFAWYREWKHAARSRPILLSNTDGEAFAMQVATYSVVNRDAVIAFLHRHAAFEHDPKTDVADDGTVSFTWLKSTKKGKSVFGSETVFGRFVVGAATIRVEVNSDRRAQKARKLLEGIAGVRFLRDEKVDLEVAMAQAAKAPSPPVDRPDPNDPAIQAMLKEFLDQRNMRWLDESIPMFGGLTPREMTKTPEGRARVARYIRTMPATMSAGGPSIEPPREAMLRELGLEDDGSGPAP